MRLLQFMKFHLFTFSAKFWSYVKQSLCAILMAKEFYDEVKLSVSGGECVSVDSFSQEVTAFLEGISQSPPDIDPFFCVL